MNYIDFSGVAIFSMLYQQAFGLAHISSYALLCTCLVVFANVVAIIMLKVISHKGDVDNTKANIVDGNADEAEGNSNKGEKKKLIED